MTIDEISLYGDDGGGMKPLMDVILIAGIYEPKGISYGLPI